MSNVLMFLLIFFDVLPSTDKSTSRMCNNTNKKCFENGMNHFGHNIRFAHCRCFDL
jgi:hypothetical protein